ncbi:hypothetical protein HUU62_09890 [Rhodoferax sp. 4810]|uniref:Uncharacterized protein n=1 Tax=Thiospirillum jenense TaxID=1653858 RepID=A0A839HDG7_9GAMM|nr:hypothetical protein [Thiospirillum jenense]MBB1074720.1 hypothetical protein [Rhodoferax jenense]MBB1125436.1 hypothetical protein [Thiospirillum jenense]
MSSEYLDQQTLRLLIEEAVHTALVNHRDLIEAAVSEAILDLKFGLAIEAGDQHDYVAANVIWAKLNDTAP